MFKSILKAVVISIMLATSIHTSQAESQTDIKTKYESAIVTVSVDPVSSTDQNLKLIKIKVTEAGHVKLKVMAKVKKSEQTLIDDDIEAGEYDVLFKTNDTLVQGSHKYLIEVTDGKGNIIYSEEKDI